MEANPKAINDHHLKAFYAMGMLEAMLTCEEIATYVPNTRYAIFEGLQPSTRLLEFLVENDKFIRQNILSHNDDYWHTAAAVIAQMDGMADGYKQSTCQAKNPLTALDFLLLQTYGDQFDLHLAYPSRPERLGANVRGRSGPRDPLLFRNYNGSAANSLREEIRGRSLRTVNHRCTGIVKLDENNQDVFFGHTTWDAYPVLWPRIFKYFTFPVRKNNKYTMHESWFSSSPGLIASLDDFYVIKGTSKISIVETSTELVNEELFQLIQPHTQLCWLRLMIANLLAASGKEWAEIYVLGNSGTYNTQWLVMDHNLFEPGSAPKPNFLTVVETMPGDAKYVDATATLNKDKWFGSYNLPMIEEIRTGMGFGRAVLEDGVEMDFDLNSRAKQISFHSKKVKTIADMRALISHNDPKDPRIRGHPVQAIAARGDLEDPEDEDHAWMGGSLDGKVSSHKLAYKGEGKPEIHARVGPPNENLPNFCWHNIEDEGEISHVGHPDCYQFAWTTISPELDSKSVEVLPY